MAVPRPDAAAERRRQLAARLLRGEEVMVTPKGEIRTLDQASRDEVAITVPEGKLAARTSLYWYENDRDLFQAEKTAMQRFFPQFTLDRLDDGRLSWLGSLCSGVPGSDRVWHLQLIYDHDHPHNDSFCGSIQVFPIDPDLESISDDLGEAIPHTLSDPASGALYLCTVEPDSFRADRHHSSTAASSLAWAAKWISAFELWMLGALSTEQFSGHRI